MKTRVSLKCFLNDSFWKSFLDSNLPETTSNLIYFKILVTLTSFILVSPKIRAINLQKNVKICPTR